MPSVIDLRHRIRSVKSTTQLTKAMKSVSAAKLKRFQGLVLQTRPYAERLKGILRQIVARDSQITHPFFQNREEKRVTLVVIAGDKGLCGAFNTNTLKFAEAKIGELSQNREVALSVLGKKGVDYFRFREREMLFSKAGLLSKPSYEGSLEISERLIDSFLDGSTDAVYLLYNKFHSVSRSEVVLEKWLPIPPVVAAGEEPFPGYEFEPSAEEIFKAMLPAYMKNGFYRILLESMASEQAARMMAMEMATQNATEVVASLILEMNKIRQTSITGEILEITTASEAMKR
ncbi:MAG: ATP synthase gamma chain, sodium ion specific [Candidatus Aminicenantes bacterium ADurb.Bin508]|nr:MAG: ATP synthase gamma chain, sodium ion specific [Candidatus Aminicenantes bacterium ADurb.Bin508]HNX42389.1 ATP synthase F1 subunit gamma [Candidatus Aminicenantes bacterium]HPB55422.1 ATP synthase F1 subunit gamma [Candidatus Aminicenantes bacterium]HPT00333.1 ATP synthase F1 subunit gamma [Candidatus Aminicenantes bacterium]